MQGTVNNIGVAYDHLHDELKTLIVFADNPYSSERESLKKESISYSERKTFLDDFMQSSFENAEKEINVKPSIRNKSEQVSSHMQKIPKSCRNAATLKTPLIRNVNIQKCNHNLATKWRSRNSKVDKYVELAFPLKEKYVQYIPRNHCEIVTRKDAETRTRYPLISTGAQAKHEHTIDNPKIRPGYVSRPGRSSCSRYHEKCAPDYYCRY